jgi:hypothetical protein
MSLALKARLVWNLRSSGVFLLSARITGMHHHAHLISTL